MAAYAYLALDAQGRQHKGLLEADSPRQARALPPAGRPSRQVPG